MVGDERGCCSCGLVHRARWAWLRRMEPNVAPATRAIRLPMIRQVTKPVLEQAFGEELTDPIGDAKHDSSGARFGEIAGLICPGSMDSVTQTHRFWCSNACRVQSGFSAMTCQKDGGVIAEMILADVAPRFSTRCGMPQSK